MSFCVLFVSQYWACCYYVVYCLIKLLAKSAFANLSLCSIFLSHNILYVTPGLVLPLFHFIIIIIVVVVVMIIIIIIEFFTSQLWLRNIHLSWDVVINRIRLGGLSCSLKSFLQLNMCQELQIFAVAYMYSGAS